MSRRARRGGLDPTVTTRIINRYGSNPCGKARDGSSADKATAAPAPRRTRVGTKVDPSISSITAASRTSYASVEFIETSRSRARVPGVDLRRAELLSRCATSRVVTYGFSAPCRLLADMSRPSAAVRGFARVLHATVRRTSDRIGCQSARHNVPKHSPQLPWRSSSGSRRKHRQGFERSRASSALTKVCEVVFRARDRRYAATVEIRAVLSASRESARQRSLRRSTGARDLRRPAAPYTVWQR